MYQLFTGIFRVSRTAPGTLHGRQARTGSRWARRRPKRGDEREWMANGEPTLPTPTTRKLLVAPRSAQAQDECKQQVRGHLPSRLKSSERSV